MVVRVVEGTNYELTFYPKNRGFQTWKAAAEQMFFSLGVGFGTLTVLGTIRSMKV